MTFFQFSAYGPKNWKHTHEHWKFIQVNLIMPYTTDLHIYILFAAMCLITDLFGKLPTIQKDGEISQFSCSGPGARNPSVWIRSTLSVFAQRLRVVSVVKATLTYSKALCWDLSLNLVVPPPIYVSASVHCPLSNPASCLMYVTVCSGRHRQAQREWGIKSLKAQVSGPAWHRMTSSKQFSTEGPDVKAFLLRWTASGATTRSQPLMTAGHGAT